MSVSEVLNTQADETSRNPSVVRHLNAHAPPNALAEISNG